jgi:hypothetical protein
MAGAAVVYAAISVLVLQLPPLNAALAFLSTCRVLGAVLPAFPRTTAGATANESGPELLARMVTAGVLVFLLTAVAPLLGPIPSGLLAAFPVYTGILTVLIT